MKARQANQQHSAYSPAYSPLAMSGSADGHGSIQAARAPGDHTMHSPLYMPQSMGGQAYSSTEQDPAIKGGVQSPQYINTGGP